MDQTWDLLEARLIRLLGRQRTRVGGRSRFGLFFLKQATWRLGMQVRLRRFASLGRAPTESLQLRLCGGPLHKRGLNNQDRAQDARAITQSLFGTQKSHSSRRVRLPTLVRGRHVQL